MAGMADILVAGMAGMADVLVAGMAGKEVLVVRRASAPEVRTPEVRMESVPRTLVVPTAGVGA